MMRELRADVILYLKMQEGETEEAASERMLKIFEENGIECSCFESSTAET